MFVAVFSIAQHGQICKFQSPLYYRDSSVSGSESEIIFKPQGNRMCSKINNNLEFYKPLNDFILLPCDSTIEISWNNFIIDQYLIDSFEFNFQKYMDFWYSNSTVP